MPAAAAISAIESAAASEEALRARLKEIIREKSFRLGELFRLVSGVESNVYFNMKPTMLDPEGGAILATLLARRLMGRGVDYVGGLELGAVPMIAQVALRSHDLGEGIAGFIVRKQPKEHGARLAIEGLARGESLEGKSVALLDDVCTTGGSAFRAAEDARAAGANIALVLAIVDRQEGAAAAAASRGLAFDALFRADEFIPEGFARLPPKAE